jgi:hypothetical protein
MTRKMRQIAKHVPEMSFIDREYKFDISKMGVGIKRDKYVPAVLNKDYLRIGRIKLPLNMKSLDNIKTYYEDGFVHLISIEFFAKGYSYDILHSDDSTSISACKRTVANVFTYSGVIDQLTEYKEAL